MNGVMLLVSDHHGINIPQVFVENHDTEKWHLDEHDVADVTGGPDNNEWYWESWSNILSDGSYTDENDNVWQLWQDGDLWAYCPELMSDEEYEEFFGEKRED